MAIRVAETMRVAKPAAKGQKKAPPGDGHIINSEGVRDGETWGTELSRALGRQGNSNKRLAWHGLGTSDHRGISYKFSASAKVVKTFMSIAADGAKIAA